jgi:Ca2+-transporting ATPase
MAARKAVVRRLAAVEALGSVTVILTDKTGTLTENRMQVRSIETINGPEVLLALVLANDADGAAGDSIDVALAEHARTHGVNQNELRRSMPRVSARDFDSAHRSQRVTVNREGRPVSYLKGAPETILEHSRLIGDTREVWIERAAEGARQGHRVLAAARAEGESETNLEFLGLIHLWDPIRPEVPAALQQAREAGIRVATVTGDHPATAAAIGALADLDTSVVVTGQDLDALAGDLPDAGIYARVRPEHKLQLVEALQKRGEVVAMTGDGVNDAPALKRADIGIAMGHRGSDVSREVA